MFFCFRWEYYTRVLELCQEKNEIFNDISIHFWYFSRTSPMPCPLGDCFWLFLLPFLKELDFAVACDILNITLDPPSVVLVRAFVVVL